MNDMKNIKNILLCIITSALVVSCADNDKLDFSVEKPDNLKNREFLDQYNVLKTYVDSVQYPIFRLGTSIALSEYIDAGLKYRILNSNFGQITISGSEMMHATVVKNDGSIDSLSIINLLDASKSGNIKVFGSALCANENQNSVYLNNLILPSTIEASGNLLNIKDLKNKSFKGWSNSGAISVNVAGGVKDEGIILTSAGTTPWELSLGSPEISINPSKNYYLSFYIKANKISKGRIYFNNTSFNYPANGQFEVKEKDKWQRVYYQVPSLKKGRSSFSFFIDLGYTDAVTYAIDVRSFALKEGIVDPNDNSQLIERTAQEKSEIIDKALETYISSMMKICATSVKSWNVVNTPMDDSNPSQIKTGQGKTLKDGEFYWQDYIGENYIARAVELARKYYTQYGGNVAELSLFVNESNLLNNDAKTNGLMNYLKKVEATKGGKVDGIGIELRAVYGDTSLESIKALFAKLAGTGKQIRISKLELAYKGTNSSEVISSALTYEQQLEVSAFLKEIVKSYFDLIPAGQCAGITYWNSFDQNNSALIGLWTLPLENTLRKYTYGGLVEGVSRKNTNGK